jgi:hypothetical protein
MAVSRWPRMARRVVLVSVLALAAVVVPVTAELPVFGAVSPQAVTRFRAPVTVVPHGCGGTSFPVDGGRGVDAAVDGRGVIRGFAGFSPGRCDGPISYFEGAGRIWRHTRTPYHGRVLAAGWDTTGTYVLYVARDGVRIAKRTPRGVFTGGHRLSLGTEISGGDLLAANGTWWAVWSELSHGQGYFLTQAKTYGRDIRRQRIIRHGDGILDFGPALAWRPGGGAVLAFSREHDTGRFTYYEPWVAGSTDGRWSARHFTLPGAPDLMGERMAVATHGSSTYLAFSSADGMLVASNESGRWRARRLRDFGGTSFDSPPRLAVTRGRLMVAWLEQALGPGNFGINRVRYAERRSGWSVTRLTPTVTSDQDTKALLVSAGRPTILASSAGTRRLYALVGSR